MAPRPRGQIIEKGPQTFLVRIPMGQRKYLNVTVKGTRTDAEKVRTQKLREKDTQQTVLPSRLTVDAYFDRWLASKVPEIAPRTHLAYSDLLRLHVRPSIGHLKLEQVSPLALQTLITGLSKTLSPRMVQYTATVMSQAFKCAVQWRLLTQSPALYLRLPKRDHSEQAIFSTADIHTLFSGTMDSPWHPLWVLLLTTGMRPQEALALQWADIDPSGTIRIQRALQQDATGHYQVGQPKTRGSKRSLMVPREVIGTLERHRMAQTRLSPWVFSNRDGRPWDLTKVRKAWYRDLEACGLPQLRLYATRHTHLSHLVMATGSLKVAQDRAGHSTSRITADTYVHLLKEGQQETSDVVQRVFFGAVAGRTA